MRPAVFLDRDGTLCEEMGYLNHLSRLRMFPYAAEAVRLINDKNVPVIIVTNQSGVARGIFPESLLREVHDSINAELARAGAGVEGIYYCAHRSEDNCNCRKPRPGLLETAAREHQLDLTRSFVVGDRYADIEMAHRSGARAILVLTGYGRGEYEYHGTRWPRQPEFVAEDLMQAAGWIIKLLHKEQK
ncbi:MAG TPA: HAD family hydrolase [Candidatus Dormibacteraeota bacterium]|nr:HAD family hydrolase [Candidatus Dormibacteraeota bacterium]